MPAEDPGLAGLVEKLGSMEPHLEYAGPVGHVIAADTGRLPISLRRPQSVGEITLATDKLKALGSIQ